MKNEKKESSKEVEKFEPTIDEGPGMGGYDPYATKTELKQVSLPFHNIETDGPLKGIFLGMGPNMATKNSDGESFNTYAFFDPKRNGFVLVPAYKVLEKINDTVEPGTTMLEIIYLGPGKTQSGKDYNKYDVKKAELKERFTAFNIDEIRSMNS